MSDVVLFHHVQGLTPGVIRFADELREAGHEVTTPDLFEGRTFDTIDAGLAHAQEIGFDTVLERGRGAVAELPTDLVYAGFSMGVLSAQMLTQTRPGARGALLCFSFIPPGEFGSWPDDVPVQIHGMENDPYFAGEGDLEAARAFVPEHDNVELFVYPGDKHLFADMSVPDYDEEAARLLLERALDFLARVGSCAASPSPP